MEVYREALEKRILGETLRAVRIKAPSVLRTYHPPYDAAVGRRVRSVRRIGKRLALGCEGDLFVVIHLMIAGRLRWLAPGASLPARMGLAAFDFDPGALVLTEAGTHRRAGIWVLEGEEALAGEDRGGAEPLEVSVAELGERLRARNRTLKRALTDPGVLSGIGNAYSDEILWEARMSPLRQTARLTEREVESLHGAIRKTLAGWVERLRAEAGDGWPEKVTAFRPEMAVHGRYRQPCRRCGEPIRRIVYADNELNYCSVCQTGGKVLADRALSRLLK